MLSFLVLIVILMICYQIARTTGTDRIEAQRTQTLTGMDYAIILIKSVEKGRSVCRSPRTMERLCERPPPGRPAKNGPL